MSRHTCVTICSCDSTVFENCLNPSLRCAGLLLQNKIIAHYVTLASSRGARLDAVRSGV